MAFTELVREHFLQSAQAKTHAAEVMAEQINNVGQMLVEALRAGNKILSCGNGGSAADAQHFSAELVNRFERDRPELAAIALTTDSSTLTSIANDYSYQDVFAKQVRAIGSKGDVLLAFTTSGNSENIIKAAKAAIDKGIKVVALTGKDGGRIANELKEITELRVPAEKTSRIQEVHIVVVHCLCDIIDTALYG